VVVFLFMPRLADAAVENLIRDVETTRFYRSESTAMQWFLYNHEAGAKIEFSITRKFANEPV